MSREIGELGCRLARSAAHDEPSSLVAVPVAAGVTRFGSAVCGCIESYNSGQGLAVSMQPSRALKHLPLALAEFNECYRDLSVFQQQKKASYGRKSNSTAIVTETGFPSFVPGWNRHFSAASTAA